MKIETERLILREFISTDDEAMFELDSSPEVHKYLGGNTISRIEQSQEVIEMIRKQYVENGIGRWAVIEKQTGNFVGWSGLKLIKEYENNHINFYDIGFRLMQKYWGNGFATETAKAAIKYGFKTLGANEIFGSVHVENTQSRKVLEKCGLIFTEKFYWKDLPCDWLKITKEDWLTLQQ